MDVLLNLQQVHQRLVNDSVGPVAPLVQQPAEGVLHSSRHRGEDVRLGLGQVNDVAVVEEFGDVDTFRINLVQHEEGLFGFVPHPLHVGFVNVDVTNSVLLDHVLVAVVDFALLGADHDRAVVGRDQGVAGIAVFQKRFNHTLELPRGRGTARIPELPRDVNFQNRLVVLGQIRLIVRQVQQALVILKHRLGCRSQNGHTASPWKVRRINHVYPPCL